VTIAITPLAVFLDSSGRVGAAGEKGSEKGSRLELNVSLEPLIRDYK
jgi:hypothetical protein